MTTCEVSYRYQGSLRASQLLALDKLKSQVYGLRSFAIDEEAGILKIGYDASRIGLKDVEAAVHAAGVPLVAMEPAPASA